MARACGLWAFIVLALALGAAACVLDPQGSRRAPNRGVRTGESGPWRGRPPVHDAGGDTAGDANAGSDGGADSNAPTGDGSASFESVAPCPTEANYEIGTTVAFTLPGVPGDLDYDPPCLRVSRGATVTFTGDFGFHPLYPSRARGTIQGNPIQATGAGSTSRGFVFSEPGFFAYYCGVHGAFDDGTGMAGVVWAE